MSYMRVIPRDLFNDASLLKCLGKLSLLAHDRMVDLVADNDGEPFMIHQDQNTGDTWVSNVWFRTKDGRELNLFRPMNSRSPWPLIMEMNDRIIYVFDEEGNPTQEFRKAISG